MDIRKDRGIVLSSRGTGEADLMAVIYTENGGKGNFRFKGIKKSVRRSQLVANPGTVIEMNYYYSENRNSFVVQEFSVLYSSEPLSKDLDKILLLHLMLECVRETTGEHDVNPAVFKYTAAAINILSDTPYKYHLALFFLVNILKTNGIVPDFSQCARCGKPFPQLYSISADDKGIVCDECCRLIKNNFLSLQIVHRNYLSASLESSFNAINHSLISESDVIIALKALTDFIEKYYHTDIKSIKTVLETAQR